MLSVPLGKGRLALHDKLFASIGETIKWLRPVGFATLGTLLVTLEACDLMAN